MSWVQIKFDTSREQAPVLAERLDAAGARAVTFQDGADQPIFEPAPGDTPLWQATQVVALFDPETDSEAILRRLRLLAAPGALPPHRVEHLPEQAWERVCMESFRPARFGRRLWICPSWGVMPGPPAVSVRLDPGMAFGTGTHPTTALCLEWLDGASLKGQHLIDYGCGSGILSIAAVLLGAGFVWAVDTDLQARTATRDNARENGVDGRVRVVSPSDLPEMKADALLANILAKPLIELAGTLAAHVRDQGAIVLSGVLREQVPEVADAYLPYFVLDAPAHQDEWARVTGRRSGVSA